MRWVGYAFWIAGAALFFWALAVAALWALQDRLIFQADGRALGDPPAGLPGFATESLATGDGLTLRFWLAPPAPGKPVIVYFHGNGGNAGDRADAMRPLVAAGYGVALTEYRGYGRNPGAPSEAALLADGAAYLALVRARFPGHRIVLWGESLGGGIALPLAAANRVAGVILDSPFTSLVEIATDKYPFVPVDTLLQTRFDNLAAIGAVHAPLLILHGERDGVVPVEFGRRLLEAANEPRRGLFLPDVPHLAFLTDGSGQALAAVEQFLAEIESGE
jgi:fermentation-respiration switch protein FrsA (DUF1100 family)